MCSAACLLSIYKLPAVLDNWLKRCGAGSKLLTEDEVHSCMTSGQPLLDIDP